MECWAKNFKVTNGVAQGCTLSPLFFAIYLDDLLIKFRESGLGIPVGALRENAFSFADDLLLLSPDTTTTERYIDILTEWCRENHLSVNIDKCGILRLGSLAVTPPETLHLNGKPLKYLEEKQPGQEKITPFKYLGASFPPNGSWTRFIDSQLAAARRTLGQHWSFFYEAETATQVKVHVGKSIVLSKLSYCQDIMLPTVSEERKINRVQEKLLKTTIRVPSYASGRVVRYILGQPSQTSQMLKSRVLNYLRIKTLPQTTRLRQIYGARVWHKSSDIFGHYEQDMAQLQRLQRLSSVTDTAYQAALERGNPEQTKPMLTQIIREGEMAELAHELRLEHPEVLNFTPAMSHPLWRLPATYSGVTAHAQWLTASIGAACDDRRDPHRHEAVCRLCGSGTETREHLLLRCKETEDLRVSLSSTIDDVSPQLAMEFERTEPSGRLPWILAGGCSKRGRQNSRSNNRIRAAESVFMRGRSVGPMHGTKDRMACRTAYHQFLNIREEVADSIHTLTARHPQATQAVEWQYTRERTKC